MGAGMKKVFQCKKLNDNIFFNNYLSYSLIYLKKYYKI